MIKTIMARGRTCQETAREIAVDAAEPVLRQTAQWLSFEPRFQDFVAKYEKKIKSKFRHARTDEDKRDVLVELETARLFLANSSMDVDYEPHCSSGPDFCIRSVHGSFNVETKRIREADATTLYNDCVSHVISELRKVPSSLGFSIDCNLLVGSPEYARRLHSSTDSIIVQCMEALKGCKATLSHGETRAFPIAPFEELQIRFTHVLGKPPDSPTADFGGVSPIFYTQRESFKFTDLMLGCLRQLRPSLPNVLLIRCHSITHEPEELEMAKDEICRLGAEEDVQFFQKKGFTTVEDFHTQFKLLTAAVVVSDSVKIPNTHGRNLVWENPSPALRLNAAQIEYLQAMC